MSNTITSLKELYYYIAMKEGGKSVTIRADIIEIIRILSDLSAQHPEALELIAKNGKRRKNKEVIKKAELRKA